MAAHQYVTVMEASLTDGRAEAEALDTLGMGKKG
jgi:hypothetical protein